MFYMLPTNWWWCHNLPKASCVWPHSTLPHPTPPPKMPLIDLFFVCDKCIQLCIEVNCTAQHGWKLKELEFQLAKWIFFCECVSRWCWVYSQPPPPALFFVRHDDYRISCVPKCHTTGPQNLKGFNNPHVARHASGYQLHQHFCSHILRATVWNVTRLFTGLRDAEGTWLGNFSFNRTGREGLIFRWHGKSIWSCPVSCRRNINPARPLSWSRNKRSRRGGNAFS